MRNVDIDRHGPFRVMVLATVYLQFNLVASKIRKFLFHEWMISMERALECCSTSIVQ